MRDTRARAVAQNSHRWTSVRRRRRAGLGNPELCEKLTNGGCAANYRCCLFSGGEVVLKACVGDDAEPLAKGQLAVLEHLAKRGSNVAPALKSMRVVPCATARVGRTTRRASGRRSGGRCGDQRGRWH